MHDLCFICNKENFVAKVCEINHPIDIRAPRGLESREIFTKIILNPLMGFHKIRTLSNNLLYQSSLDQILSLQQSIQDSDKNESERIVDNLCGWEYGIHYLQNFCKGHLEAFEFISIYFKRRFNSYTVHCFASVLYDIQITNDNVEMFTYVCDSLTKLLISQYTVSKEGNQAITQLYASRLRLANYKKIYTCDEVFNSLFDLYAKHNKHATEYFGYLCFTQMDKSVQLWGVFYDHISQKQKQDHVQTILRAHDQKCGVESIQKLLLLAKELKKKQDYFLSILLFSFLRKLFKLIQFTEYHPFIYANLAKLALYICEVEDSMTLYKNAIEKIENTKNNKLKLHKVKESKLHFRYLVTSLYAEENPSLPRKIIKDLLLKDKQAPCLTQAQRSFVELAQIFTDKQHTSSYKHNQKFRYQYCKQLTDYLMQQHMNTKVQPTNCMQEQANVIELKGRKMTQIKCKQVGLLESLVGILAPDGEFQSDEQQNIPVLTLPKGCNIVFNILCINFIIKANLNLDQLDVMNYKQQAECIESILTEMNPELYPILAKILSYCENQDQDEFIHFELLLYTQINAFLDDYENAMRYLQKFKDQMKKWKASNKCCKKESNIQGQLWQVDQIAQRFECNILLASNEQYVDPNQNNEDAFHQLGQLLFTKGQFKDSLKWLLKAGKHPKYQQQVKQRCEELYTMCGGDNFIIDSDSSSIDKLEMKLQSFDLNSLNGSQQSTATNADTISRAQSITFQQDQQQLNLSDSESTIPVYDILAVSNAYSTYSSQRGSMQRSRLSSSIMTSSMQSSLICGRKDLISLSQTLSHKFEDITLSIIMREILKSAEDLPNIQDTRTIKKQNSLTSGTSVWRQQETNETFCIKTILASNSKNNHVDEIKLALQEILCLLICRNKQNLCQLKYLEINTEKRKDYEAIEFNLYFPYYPDTFIEYLTDLKESKPNKFRNALLKLIDAVDAMNKLGIYHMDLKHSNILYQDDQPYIIDFGSAYYKIDSIHISGVGQTIGYFDQNEDKSQTYTKADTYALGCILYNLLTKKDPADGIKLHLVEEQYREFVRLCTVNYDERLPLDQLRQYIL